MSVETYGIKSGYVINPNPRPYHDTVENSVRYQRDVYRRAGELARQLEVRSVADIGCGLATKLVEQVAPHCEEVTGVDLEGMVALCRQRHRVGRWIAGDVEDPNFTLDRSYDLIVCADVIEHLRDPDRVLEVIRAASHDETVVVFSTPDRDRRRGPDDMGPPPNWAHVREWSAGEFCGYLESRGFVVRESSIVDLCDGIVTCHLVVGGFRRGRP